MKNEKKNNTAENFLIKNCMLLITKVQEKPSVLSREHPALPKKGNSLTFLFVCGSFFALLDPDCEPGSGYGSRDPPESGSGTTTLFVTGAHFILEKDYRVSER
jgi:hypothetical protein